MKPGVYDNNGNMRSSTTTAPASTATYEYDLRNNMVKVSQGISITTSKYNGETD